ALLGDTGDHAALTRASEMVHRRREELAARGIAARAAAFTSTRAGEDAVRLATGQSAELLLLDAAPADVESMGGELIPVVAERAPCDVGLYVPRANARRLEAGDVVLVPFGAEEDDWGAVEVAAWLTASLGGRLTLLGVEAGPTGARDASRMLANASLLIQRM